MTLSNVSQMKHQLDATLCGFYFYRVTLHVSAASHHHQEYLKTSSAATGTCVIVAGQSSHLLIRAGSSSGPNKEMLNMFRAIISLVLRCTRLCLQLVV